MTCKDCIYFDEVACSREDSDGNEVKWAVPVCKGGMYVDIGGDMEPCEMFREGE